MIIGRLSILSNYITQPYQYHFRLHKMEYHLAASNYSSGTHVFQFMENDIEVEVGRIDLLTYRLYL